MDKRYKKILLAGTIIFSVLYMVTLLLFTPVNSEILTAVCRLLLAGISITLGANLIFLVPFDKDFNLQSTLLKFILQAVLIIAVCIFIYFTNVFRMDLNLHGFFLNIAGCIISLTAVVLSNQIKTEKFIVLEFSVLMFFRGIFMLHCGLIFAYLFKTLLMVLSITEFTV